jgi:hypothetical protein
MSKRGTPPDTVQPMGWFLGISGVVQLLIALWALKIGRDALKVSERVEQDARSERERADHRDRLMWMQTLLNELRPVQEAMAAPHETEYHNRQRWMKTCLATAGLRDRLPATVAVSERPYSDGWPGMVADVDKAWTELHDALEHEADRAYAGQRLG